ncbi:MAG: D-tyrosyl-tRNA(Tyr) deacylase [Acidobacteria bacterium]|nr:D-tyrosyl-tRNA(Tyr) deacylase [Acidobacteriota bacterium]
MRAVVQRVSRASCSVDGKTVGEIGRGLVLFLGVGRDDTEEDLEFLANKITNLRIFEDEAGRMNLSVKETGGSVLLISQFTLYGDARKGNRPSFIDAAPPEVARRYYDKMAERLRCEVPVQTGVFQSMMDIDLVNAGPVTILLDSKRIF